MRNNHIQGIPLHKAGWLLRMFYNTVINQTKKLTGKSDLAESMQISAHQPWALFGTAMMEMGQLSFKSLPPRLKSLASLRTATLIGCPY